MESHIVTIVPPHEELSSVRTCIRCTERNCDSVFQSSANLQMHLVKHHKVSTGLLKHGRMNAKFACPVENCKYDIKASKHFTKMKALKQHYLKCHANKQFSCKKCKKSFPTMSMYNGHKKVCGKKFICSCGWTYTSNEALLTHCKRKKHEPAETKESRLGDAKDLVVSPEKNIAKSEENTVVKVCFTSPSHSRSPRKPSSDVTVFPTHYIAAIALSELSTTFIIPKNCHIGVQTADSKISKKKSPNDKKRKSSQETQTLSNEVKKQKISAETQTRTHVKRKMETKPTLRQRKKSIETQTKDPMPFLSGVENESMDGVIFNESSLSNSSIKIDPAQKSSSTPHLDDDSAWDSQNFNKEIQQSSKPFMSSINSDMFSLNNELTMGSRGNDLPLSNFNNFDLTKLCNIETQTELDTILQTDEGTSTTETQTTNDLIDDDLLYSNMCTQTCDDVSDLFDFNFVDIETQTAWPVL